MPAPNAGVVNTATPSGVTEFLFGKLNTQQTTNLAAGDHLKFDTVVASRGTSIALDTTTAYVTTIGAASIGRLTLKANRTYRLRASVPYFLGSGATGQMNLTFYDATANAELAGGRISLLVATTATHDIGGGYAEAVFTPGQDSLVELRVQTVTASLQIGTTGNATPTVFVETL